MRLSPTGRCLATSMIVVQLALFAYVNTALQQCEQLREGPEGAPSFDDLIVQKASSAAADQEIAELRRELEQEHRTRVQLQTELQRLHQQQQEQQQHDVGNSATVLLLSSAEEAEADDGGDGPQGDADAAHELNADDSAETVLVFDDGSQRGRVGDHPMRRFHRPLLVRFSNYNATNPVRTPYGGEAARRWFQRHGYVETESNDWDVLWCGKGQYLNFASQSLDLPRPWQSHNHCLGAGLLAGNKGSFVTHHNIMARQFPQDYTHVPETFDLPLQHASLLARMKEHPDEMYECYTIIIYYMPYASTATYPRHHMHVLKLLIVAFGRWIFKPSTGARGEGIRLVWEGSQVPRAGRNTVQRYIDQPCVVYCALRGCSACHKGLRTIVAEQVPG